ncbi:site-specific DNA-methyltransferase [Hornefia butyriciproducens]|uniref:site-specific DNA-methyltransferase n=1 Tax=Hornefia butyriciproducens TaxID=2652293 RepID=UPI003F89D7AF
MDKMRMESVDMTAQNIEKIGALFPNCITETVDENGAPKKAINFELLKQMLSGDVLEGDESYEFTWVGKKAAIVEANKPIRKTLRPCPEESVDWDKTRNLYIEGNNLDVLKLLQESYLNSIKMIYIDPPYNTGSDFVYPDSFMMELSEYNDGIGYFDEDGNVNFERENNDTNARFHSDWCTMIYSRLLLARNLLRDDGVIFISIDDGELYGLKQMCDDVFGAANYVGTVTRISKTTSFRGNYFAPSKDYILTYAKSISSLPQFQDEVNNDSQFNKIETDGPRKGEYYRDDIAFYLSTLQTRPNQRYYIECPDGELVVPPGETMPPNGVDGDKAVPVDGDGVWRWERDQYLQKKHLLSFKKTKTSPLLNQNGEKASWNIYTKSYLLDKKEKGNIPRDIFEGYLNRNGTEELKKIGIPFSFPKPSKLVKYLMKISGVTNGDIVLDFFSGSASCAQAAMELNNENGISCQFIMVQLPENTYVVKDEKKVGKKGFEDSFRGGFETICEIGKERIRRVGNNIKDDNPLLSVECDLGFRVLKLDDSNMTDVYYNPAEYSQDLLSMLESNVKADRNDLDLLFGCLLEWGLPLSLPYNSEQIDGCTIHNYNDGDLIACFDENVPDSVIKEIAKRQPLRAVFRDNSFADSPSKINVGEVFKLLAPDTRVKVI